MLHVNKYAKNSVCFCPSPVRIIMFKDGKVDMVRFLNELVVPYFYGLSYFEEHKKWPLGEYSHGVLGILEFYFEHIKGKIGSKEILQATLHSLSTINKYISKSIITGIYLKASKLCPCGSGLEFQTCHFPAYQGARMIERDYKILKEGIVSFTISAIRKNC